MPGAQPRAHGYRHRLDRVRGLALPQPGVDLQAIRAVERVLPFAILGIDTDNDSAFMGEALYHCCQDRGIDQTRSRAYKKNDQAWLEQKNGAIVRRMVGYGRLRGPLATQRLAELYDQVRWFINGFQPSFKLISKNLGQCAHTQAVRLPEDALGAPSGSQSLE